LKEKDHVIPILAIFLHEWQLNYEERDDKLDIKWLKETGLKLQKFHELKKRAVYSFIPKDNLLAIVKNLPLITIDYIEGYSAYYKMPPNLEISEKLSTVSCAQLVKFFLDINKKDAAFRILDSGTCVGEEIEAMLSYEELTGQILSFTKLGIKVKDAAEICFSMNIFFLADKHPALLTRRKSV
jgi:hypothetical protein